MVRYDHHRGAHRGLTGPIHVPKGLASSVSAVLGLHDRPAARRHHPATAPKRAPSPTPFHPSDVASAYRFPQHADGTGQCIGIIELGGGYYRSDLEKFFAELKLPTPHISDVSVHGAKNSPGDRAGLTKFMSALTSGGKGASAIKQLMSATDAKSRREADLLQSTVETTMDIEIAAAFAPGARIVVYFAHNSEQGIYNALTAALADKRHRPNVLSLSWGEPEPGVSLNYMTLIDNVLKNLAHIGVTVCVSSGDFGAHNGSPKGKPSVNFPASSPHALGCGGTELKISGDKIESEVVWNCIFDGMHGATGGGVSSSFDRPFWQNSFDVPHASQHPKTGRGVPDVAGVADPHSGCRILVGGVDGVSSGTSAVAPMWAALIARLNQALGAQSGYLNSLLYRFAAAEKDDSAFRAIIEGENGAYRAGPGWNACTGLGSPLGDRLLAALSGPSK
jgi:kumamolisin